MKNTFKIGTILCSVILASSANASMKSKNQDLGYQCLELSRTVYLLISNQKKSRCSEKLLLASQYIEDAGESLIDNAIEEAKKDMDQSISALQYAELETCNRYIQISHSKIEAQKIKNAIE